MKTELIDLSPTRKEIKIEIEPADVRKSYDRISDRYAQLANVPGFRRGHAPRAVVRTRYKSEIRSEVLRELVPDAISEAIDKHERALGVLIQAERKAAKPGDLFAPAMQRLVRNLLRPVFVGKDGQQPFYTMRFVKGRTFAQAAADYHEKRRTGDGLTRHRSRQRDPQWNTRHRCRPRCGRNG